MPSGRASKRARQKQRRAARVEVWTQAYRRRRRQRLFLFGGSLLVIAIGVGIVLLANPFSATKQTPKATPRAPAVIPTPGPVACGAKRPPSAGAVRQTYPKPGDAKLDPDKKYVWKLDTSCGEIDIALDVENNPKTTNSIAFLANNKFFDGIFFHRISQSVTVIQGGDPTGEGVGGAGYSVTEPPSDDTTYTRGIVAMAKSGQEAPGTSGSQFFIVFGDGAKPLPKDYAVVGEVVDGMSVVDKISKTGDPQEKPKAYTYIESSTVVAE